ncbi:hypothetical protein BESB_073360 [Besnoitia besnoiti]|uniref:Transmembrane protein n=1 Tax=Besnoitia besnoiti TaxID=94643 RepID=A0A2A9MAG1_BESBE|nr:uncharacterized protein BESB_073360 [Besnoitia besnoiti]PFH34184.1 hypothetical protein BESB_073360 [Besnoitia besnoiti]
MPSLELQQLVAVEEAPGHELLHVKGVIFSCANLTFVCTSLMYPAMPSRVVGPFKGAVMDKATLRQKNGAVRVAGGERGHKHGRVEVYLCIAASIQAVISLSPLYRMASLYTFAGTRTAYTLGSVEAPARYEADEATAQLHRMVMESPLLPPVIDFCVPSRPVVNSFRQFWFAPGDGPTRNLQRRLQTVNVVNEAIVSMRNIEESLRSPTYSGPGHPPESIQALFGEDEAHLGQTLQNMQQAFADMEATSVLIRSPAYWGQMRKTVFGDVAHEVLCESDQHESPHPTVPAKVQPLSEPAAGAAIKEDSLADSSASTLKPVPGGYEERRRSIRIGAAIQSSKVLKLFLACICLFAASLLRFSKCVAGAGNGADGPLTQGSRRRRLAAGGPPDGHEHSLEEECKQLTTGGLSGGAQSTASNATGGEPSSTSEGGTPIYSAGEQGAGSVALPDLDNDEPTREMLDLLEDAEKAADVVGDLTNITQALQSVLYGPEDIPLDLVLSTSAEQAGLLRDALNRLSALLPSLQRIFTLLADPGNRGHPREKLFARAEFDMKLLSRALYDALADARVYTHLARPPLGTPGGSLVPANSGDKQVAVEGAGGVHVSEEVPVAGTDASEGSRVSVHEKQQTAAAGVVGRRKVFVAAALVASISFMAAVLLYKYVRCVKDRKARRASGLLRRRLAAAGEGESPDDDDVKKACAAAVVWGFGSEEEAGAAGGGEEDDGGDGSTATLVKRVELVRVALESTLPDGESPMSPAAAVEALEALVLNMEDIVEALEQLVYLLEAGVSQVAAGGGSHDWSEGASGPTADLAANISELTGALTRLAEVYDRCRDTYAEITGLTLRSFPLFEHRASLLNGARQLHITVYQGSGDAGSTSDAE